MIEVLLNPQKEVHGVTVHALTLTDFATLFTQYRDEMLNLMEKADFSEFVVSSPKFIATIIGLATRSPSDQLVNLPAGIQLNFLVTTWELSQVTPEQLGKVLTGVIQGIQIVASQLPSNSQKI
jgi:radical SAM superfamily enzyme